MTSPLRRPTAGLTVALAVLLLARILDHGSLAARDAALIIGSLALYALIPVTVLWFILAAVRARRTRHGGGRP